MNTGNLKFYFALVLAIVCIAQCTAAPSSKEESETTKNPVASSAEKTESTVVIGNVNGTPQLSTLHNAAATDSSSQSAHEAQILKRVRRNKHPIRYHSKTLRRQ